MPSTSSQPPVEEPETEEPPQDSEADGDSEADEAGEKRADGADSADEAVDQQDEDAPDEPRGQAVHPYKFFYAKKYYADPGVFVFDKGHALRVPDGSAAASVASAKAIKTWRDAGLQTRHVKKAKLNGETVFYVTFKFGDEENTGDRLVPRAIPKEVSKKIFDEWKEAGWSDKKKEMFGELLKDAPSENSQLNPIAAGWKEVKAPADVKFFKQPSKKRGATDDAATGESSAKAAKTGKQLAKPAGDAAAQQPAAAAALVPKSRTAEEDAQSMGGQSTSILPLSGAEQIGSGQRGFNFYAHTPGMVNIPESLFRELMERAYGPTTAK